MNGVWASQLQANGVFILRNTQIASMIFCWKQAKVPEKNHVSIMLTVYSKYKCYSKFSENFLNNLIRCFFGLSSQILKFRPANFFHSSELCKLREVCEARLRLKKPMYISSVFPVSLHRRLSLFIFSLKLVTVESNFSWRRTGLSLISQQSWLTFLKNYTVFS